VTCNSGLCQPTCETGFTDCNGTCIDLAGDRDNCGACGNVCTYPCSCQTSVDGVSFCTHGGYCRGCTHDAECAVPGDPTVFYCVDQGIDICGAGYTTTCWTPC
jgi:hypothetical protein